MTRSTSPRRALIILGAATAALYIVLAILDFALKDTGGPSIVTFEFVGTPERAAEILGEWGDRGHDLALWSLWIDYAFMAAYGTFLAVASLATRDLARERGLARLAAAGTPAALAGAGAALFDAAENTALLLIVGGHGGDAAPPIATACASVKFLLLALCIAYLVWGLIARRRR